jgi:hypothetical protein
MGTLFGAMVGGRFALRGRGRVRALGCGAGPFAAQVVTYPAPAEEIVAADYRVEVNGRPVDVYRAESQYFDKKYYFASFDFSGDVTVRVTSTQSLAV